MKNRRSGAANLIAAIAGVIVGLGLIALLYFVVYPMVEKNLQGDEEKQRRAMTLTAEEPYVLINTDMEVVFTVDAGQSASLELELYAGENPCGTFADDGSAGDETADDGIYSAAVMVHQAVRRQDYVVKDLKGNVRSNILTVYAFDPFTEESTLAARTNMEMVGDAIEEIQQKYLGPNGYILPESYEALGKEEAAYLDTLSEDIILLYAPDPETGTLYIKYSCGIGAVYQAKGPDDCAADGTSEDLQITLYQPHEDIRSPEAVEYARLPAALLPNVRVGGEYKASEVTLDVVRNLPPNSVIVWRGHGGYDEVLKNFLITGEIWQWNKMHQSEEYQKDAIANRIIATKEGDTAITAGFIKRYCGQVDNDLIFLGSCYSGNGSRLADAFLHNGAEAVLTFTYQVWAPYTRDIISNVLVQMSLINPVTHSLYTFSEAVHYAMGRYGRDDGIWLTMNLPDQEPKSPDSEPRMHGNEGYQLARSYCMDVVVQDAATHTFLENVDMAIPFVYNGEYNYEEVVTRSDGSKAYRFYLPATNGILSVAAEGYQSVEKELQASDFGTDENIELVIEMQPLRQVIVTADLQTDILEGSYEIYQSVPMVFIPGNKDAEVKINSSEAMRNSLEEGKNNAAQVRSAAAEGYSMYALSSCLSVDSAYNSGDLLSISFYSADYYGGAHGQSYGWSYLFDIQTGATLTMQDILNPDNPQALDELAGLCSFHFPAETDGFMSASAYEVAMKALTDESRKVCFIPEGLCLRFNPYEIGPYAAGFILVTVPYADLGNIINSRYLPAPYTEPLHGSLHQTAANDPNLAGHTMYGISNDRLVYAEGEVRDVTVSADNMTKLRFYANSLLPGDAVRIAPALTTLPNYTITYLQGDPGAYSMYTEKWDGV